LLTVLSKIDTKIADIGKIKFDEDRHFEITKEVSKLTTDIGIKNAEIERLEQVVKDLIAGGICQACNRKLDDIDNTQHIDEHNKTIEKLSKEVQKLDKNLKKLNDELK
jgi:cell division protein FtsB